MLKWAAILILWSITQYCCAQDRINAGNGITIRPEILKLTNEIANFNEINSAHVGIGGSRSEQWDRFEQLRQKATTAELKKLTNHKNGVVKCYAFDALSDRKDVNVSILWRQHLEDTQSVMTLNGCLGWKQSVGEYLLFDCALSKRFADIVDSVLVFSKSIQCLQRDDFLLQLKPNATYYKRIQEIVTKEKSVYALVALSRFKKNRDTTIIKQFLKAGTQEYYAEFAAREFPSKTFYPYLVKLFETGLQFEHFNLANWRMLFQALSRYPNEKTLALFSGITKIDNTYVRQKLCGFMVTAIRKYPDKRFDEIENQIHPDDATLREVEENLKNEMEK